jgi:hypothetical protein
MKKYGYLDVATVSKRGWTPTIVLVNGIDVSDDCVACDDIKGYATLYVRSQDGKIHADPLTGKPRLVRVTGEIEIYPKEVWNGIVARLMASVR